MQCFLLSFSNILLSDRASQGTRSSLFQAGWLATERVPKICLSSTSSVLEFRSLASTPASYGYGRLELRSEHLPNKNSRPPNRSLDLHRVSLSVTRTFPWNMHILSPHSRVFGAGLRDLWCHRYKVVRSGYMGTCRKSGSWPNTC